MKKVDYIIVGQGLAGSWLAYFLLQAGKKIVVVDNKHHGSASKVASGIVNPITGRLFLGTWLHNEVMMSVYNCYTQIELFLQNRFFYPRPVLWFLYEKNQLDMVQKIIDNPLADQKKYIQCVLNFNANNDFFEHMEGFCEINSGGYVDVPYFLEAFRYFLQTNGLLIETKIDYADIFLPQNSTNKVTWKGDEGLFEAEKIIFCEGSQVQENPFFNHLPFKFAKGEALIIKTQTPLPQNLDNTIIKGKTFVLPLALYAQHYWVGSNFEWRDLSLTPTKQVGDLIVQNVKNTLKTDFEIVHHMAGIRPSTAPRRPFIDVHATHSQLAIFNGFGTKGVSLAPFFAQSFVQFLCGKNPLFFKNYPEVSIQSYIPK